MTEFIEHPLIKPNVMEKRSYQLALARAATERSSMIVLPTGLGKTIIATLVIANRLEKLNRSSNGDGKAIFLAPTKPLVEQHAKFLRDVMVIPPDEIQVFTGELAPSRRPLQWAKARIIVSTPQVIENDLLHERISLENVVHITFDECHRAVGNYSYVHIAEEYVKERDHLVLGITASPGSNTDKIREVCSNLGIDSIEIRTEYDDDVAPYAYGKKIEWRELSVPREMVDLGKLLEEVLEERLNELHILGFLPKMRDISVKDLLELQGKIQLLLTQQKHSNLYRAVSLVAEVFKIKHGIVLVETQGVSALRRYLDRLENDASKASKRLLASKKVRKAIHLLEEYKGEHPKLEAVCDILSEQTDPDSRTIIFTSYRDTADMLNEYLRGIGIRSAKFIGQASKYKDRGLTQRQQVEILDKFRNGEYNVLVATSVAEEGLDIPSTDLVLFYEPVPSEIRGIQRKGRTGRGRFGRIIVLIVKGTKDEAYYWISKRKEEMMYQRMSKGALRDFDVKIFVDRREMRSSVVESLERLEADLVIETMDVGDYVLSDRVCVERKRVGDLLNSMTGERKYIFEQLSSLRQYEKPLLIIEGDLNRVESKVHKNAIRGLLSSILIDFGIPIIQTEDEDDTAVLIYTIAKREQSSRHEFDPHGKKPSSTLREQQEYLISSISNIGPVLARNLLRRFNSVENVVTASKEELMRVDRVGSMIADGIREVVGSRYEE